MERKWLMLAISLFAASSYFFAMQTVPPVILQIMDSFEVSHAEAGLLMLVVALPAAVLSLPAGVMTVRWGPKRVCRLGLVISTLGVLTTYLASSFLVLGIGRFILGSGGIVVIISTYSGNSHWFSKEELGKAQGISTLNMPIAVIIALNFLPIVASGFGWKAGFLIATVALGVSTIVYFFLFEEKNQIKQATGTLLGLKNKQAWILGAVWGLFVLVYQSYVTWAGTFFIEFKNIPSGIAFFMASFVMVPMILLGPVAGILSDKSGKRKIFLMIAFLGMGVSFLLIPGLSFPLLFLPVTLLAVSSAFLPPALYALPSEILSSRMAGVVYGILFTCWSVGVLTGPTFVGYVRDTFSGELPIYLVLATFSFLALICVSFLKTK